ncbi:MAG: hypothetical protein ACI4B9_01580 [Eggerthellaceae bacterium]
MKLTDFIAGEMPGASELASFCASSIAGAQLRRITACPFEGREFRKLLAAYAGSSEGPYGMGRVRLYHQVCDLFEALRLLPGNAGLKAYELKDSFLGGQEADLVMLLASHEGISQEALAHDVLRCSKNAVGERRARMKDGIRIGGMCIQAEFGYRGDFRSSVHPVSLPLNLSEAYVLFDALAEYSARRDFRDPHRKSAERVAGMLKAQMSPYAKERLAPRLDEMGFGALPEVPPCFAFDVPQVGGADTACAPDSGHWLYFLKSGELATVELSGGRCLRGVVIPNAKVPAFLEGRDMVQKDRRPHCVVLHEDGDFTLVPWSDVVDIRVAE